jgi:hypothetical protein
MARDACCNFKLMQHRSQGRMRSVSSSMSIWPRGVITDLHDSVGIINSQSYLRGKAEVIVFWGVAVQ